MNATDRELDILIRARYPIIYLISHEEARVEAAVRAVVDGRKQVMVWSATEPFAPPENVDRPFDPYHRIPLDGLGQALDALNFILKQIRQADARAVYILRDFDAYLDNPVIVRRLRDLVAVLKRSYASVIILSPTLVIPTQLDKEIAVVDYALPGQEEVAEILDELAERVGGAAAVASIAPATREALVHAALGLTVDEAANVFSKAMVAAGGTAGLDVQIVLAEKKQILRKTGILEYYEADANMAGIGGLAHLKDWLSKRGAAFSERARAFGLPAPRGVLLLGVPGCGKSLTARAIGASWQLPLLRFDVGAVFGKYVGESEANLRRALRAAEAVAPCVLWIDELEKAFSPARGDDGGTTMRILGGFLSWLQEKRAPVFVVGTANNIEMLPPELLRKGRLDDIFFVDLPHVAERAAIFAIHLAKRGRDAATFDVDALARHSDGYSGAEIEQAVVAALYDAFEKDRELQDGDILANLTAMVPLSRTMEEEVLKLREWAATRARPASLPAGA